MLNRFALLIIMSVSLLLCIAGVRTGVLHAAPGTAAEKHILILSPYSPDFPASESSIRGIKGRFQQYSQYRFNYSHEYFDLARFAKTDGYVEEAFRYIQRKYANHRPDLVVSDLEALNVFLEKYGQELFSGVAVVSQRGLIGRENGKSVLSPDSDKWFIEDAEKNIKLILQTRPQTRKIYIITGESELERRIRRPIAIAAKQYGNRAEFVFVNHMPFDELIKTVGAIDNQSAIFFVQWTVDSAGRMLPSAEVLQAICREAKVPVYSIAAHYLGTGMVGGYVMDWEKNGRQIAENGIAVLNGQKPRDTALGNAQNNQYVFDWRQLKRWKINESSLPPDSRIEFREFSFWDLYKWQILGVLAVVVFEAILIIVLLFVRARQLKAEAGLRRLNMELENMVRDRTHELVKLNGQLELTARTDGLTGLNNRRYMSERITDEFARFARHGKAFSLVIADVDWFKKINDSFGHQVGDCILKSIADDLRTEIRACDSVARWGGEEFLLLFPETDAKQAVILVERLRKQIADKVFCCENNQLHVAMTFGIAVAKEGDTVDNMMKRADNALYKGKHEGRNRVVVE